jgi:hypothetical protein
MPLIHSTQSLWVDAANPFDPEPLGVGPLDSIGLETCGGVKADYQSASCCGASPTIAKTDKTSCMEVGGYCHIDFNVAEMFKVITPEYYAQNIAPLFAGFPGIVPPPPASSGMTVTFFDIVRQMNPAIKAAAANTKTTYLMTAFFENFYVTYDDDTSADQFYTYYYMSPVVDGAWDSTKLIQSLVGTNVPATMGCHIIENYQNPAALMIQFQGVLGFYPNVGFFSMIMNQFRARWLYPPVCDTAPDTVGCSATVVQDTNMATGEVTKKHYTWSEFKTYIATEIPETLPTMTPPISANSFVGTFHPLANSYC